jgi:erythritol transport system substrate-binding protein
VISGNDEMALGAIAALNKAAAEVANWDRTLGHNKMQSMMQANPDIKGVISGNDEMALGAIAALKKAGKLKDVVVGGFDGSPDAVAAVKAGELAYTVLQPVAVFAAEGVKQADNFIRTGSTGAKTEKQLFECMLITKENVGKYSAPFVLDN